MKPLCRGMAAVACLGLSACATAVSPVDDPCVMAWETKALLGIVRPWSVAIGPSVERVVVANPECEVVTVATGNSLELELNQ